MSSTVALAPGLDAVRPAVSGQFSLLAQHVGDIDAAGMQRHTRLEGWLVRELTAHAARSFAAVGAAITKPEPRVRQLTLPGYYDAVEADALGIAARAIEDALLVQPSAWCSYFTEVVGSVVGRLARVEQERLVLVRHGTMSLSEFLVVECVEGVVHGLDLARALGLDPEALLDMRATMQCVDFLAARVRMRAESVFAAPVETVIGHHTITVSAGGHHSEIELLDFIEWSTGRAAPTAEWLGALGGRGTYW